MKSTTATDIPGFTAVTTNIHTPKEIALNKLSAIWRALDSMIRIKLSTMKREGNVRISTDARAGFGRGRTK